MKKNSTETAPKPKRYDHAGGLKARRNRQNQRTFRNIQKRRAKHDKAHGLPEGATNSKSKRWTLAPSAK